LLISSLIDSAPNQEELAALGVGEELAAWRSMAVEIPALLAEA